MKNQTTFFLSFCLVFTFGTSQVFGQSSTIYFTGTSGAQVWSANKDGTGTPIELYNNSDGVPNFGPVGIDINFATGGLYFGGGNTWDIFTGSTDGSAPIGTLASASTLGWEHLDLEFDWNAGKIYFTGDEQGLFVANADGTGTRDTLTETDATHLVLDRTNNKIYFSRPGQNISVINTDGTGEINNHISAGAEARGITMDEATGTLYWIEKFGDIYSAPANGLQSPTLLYNNTLGGNGYGIDFEKSTNTLYWTVFNNNSLVDNIVSASADGLGTPTVLFSGSFGSIRGIAAGRNIQNGVTSTCATTNSFGPIWINSAYKAAGANDPQTYYWGLSEGTIVARPQNGVGPYTYQWSSDMGYMIKDDTKKRARLWYPTGPQWVKVAITDVGAGCTIEDSVYVDWVDYTCNQPSIWYYELCNTVTNTTSCVQGTVNMRNLVNTGDYVYGPCVVPQKRETTLSSEDEIFGVSVFPNPSNGQFTYVLNATESANHTISVMDINGRTLYSETVESTDTYTTKELDLSNLSAGVYIFQVSDENNSAVKRFVIQ